jgi:hypothetical protein
MAQSGMPERITAPPATAHQKIVAIYDYWRGLIPGPGRLPARKQIDPCDIPPLLEHIWLVDVVGEPMRFRFRLIGEAGRRMGPPGKPGDFLDQYHEGGVSDPALDDFRFAAKERLPVWYRGKALTRHRTEMFELERLFLPLANNGVEVDALLCLSVFYTPRGAEI